LEKKKKLTACQKEKERKNMKSILIIGLVLIANVNAVNAANRYVDSAASGANNGTSWTDAWTSLGAVSGIGPGDVIYVSGGSTTKLYLMGGWALSTSGTEAAPITVRIGQEPGHNGTAIFRNNAGSEWWITANTAQGKGDWWTFNGRLDGDNKNHFRVENYRKIVRTEHDNTHGDSSPGIKGVKWLGITSAGGAGVIYMYNSDRIEIGWCIWEAIGDDTNYPSGSSPGRLYSIGRYGTPGWGINQIHDNIFNLLYCHNVDQYGDNGDDAMQYVYNCDIYNNQILSSLAGAGVYQGNNHQDGIQVGPGYQRIYNNLFKNISNYCIYLEDFGGGERSHAYVFNNIFWYADPQLTNQPSAAITVGNHSLGSYSDVLIFNNTFYKGKSAINWSQGPAWPASEIKSSCRVQNNLVTGPGGFTFSPNNHAIVSHNATGFAESGWVSAVNGDFHLKSTAFVAINTGTNANAGVTTKDKDGVTRPQGSAWDIGAYEYTTEGPGPTPTPTPGPTPEPTPAPTPPLMDGLEFEAESMLVEAPFTVSQGMVSQNVQTTDPAQGGRATARMMIPSAGEYTASLKVNAPHGGADSLFIDFDQAPIAPITIFDVLPTNQVESRIVNWRGSGDPETPQFVPKRWTLSAGEHTIRIVGREPNLLIDSVMISLAAEPGPSPSPTPTPGPSPTPTPGPTPGPSPTPSPDKIQIGDVEGLQESLDSLQNQINTHTHQTGPAQPQ
jgi:hypothetical protein